MTDPSPGPGTAPPPDEGHHDDDQGECGEPIDRAEVEAVLDRWRRLLAWLDRAGAEE